MAVRLQFVNDAGDFLAAAGEYLSQNPVQSTVAATVAERFSGGDEGAPDDWWLVVYDGNDVVSAGMRTAPFPPRSVFLMAMPDEAAVLLARTVYGRQETLVGLNGALPTVRVCADELARLSGAAVEVAVRTWLFELLEVIPAAHTDGHLRPGGGEPGELWGGPARTRLHSDRTSRPRLCERGQR